MRRVLFALCVGFVALFWVPLHAALTTNLQAFYALESGALTTDSTGNGNTLTDVNTVTEATGKVGGSGQWTSANSEALFVADGASLSLGMGVDVTVTAWVYMDTKAATMVAFNQWNTADSGSGQNFVLEYYQTNDRFRVAVRHSNTAVTILEDSQLGSPSTATWYFVAFQFEAATAIVRLCINALTCDENDTANDFLGDVTAKFVLGAQQTGAATYQAYWNGRIDQVSFNKTLLTSNDLAAAYCSGTGLTYAQWIGSGCGGAPLGALLGIGR